MLAEAKRIRRRARVAVVACVAVSVVLALVVPVGQGVIPAILLATSGSVAASSVFVRWAERARVGPASDVLTFSGDRYAQAWQAIDGRASAPTRRDEALVRLGTRADDLATTLRLGTYWRFGDLDAFRSGLAAWQPGDQVAAARKALYASRLAFFDGVDDLREARATTARIQDPEARQVEEVLLATEASRRAAILGHDPLEPLVRARPALGALALPVVGPARRRWRRRQWLRWGIGVGLVPALVAAFVVSGSWPDPIIYGVQMTGTALISASSGDQAKAVHLIEDGVASATLLAGPLDESATDDAETGAGPTIEICVPAGVHAPASLPFPTIYCVTVLTGDYTGEQQGRALVTAVAPPDIFGNPLSAIGQPPAPTYLVTFPPASVAELLAVLHPSPYANDGSVLHFAGAGGEHVGPDVEATLAPRIDAALPTAVLVSGPFNAVEIDAITAREAPAFGWIPGGRVTSLPKSPPGQRIYEVLVFGTSTTGDAIVTFDSKNGPAYLYHLDPSLAALVVQAFNAPTSAP